MLLAWQCQTMLKPNNRCWPTGRALCQAGGCHHKSMPQTWLAENASQHFNIVYHLPSLYHCVFNCHCSEWPAVCLISLCIWQNICYIKGVPKIEIIFFSCFLVLIKTHFNYSTAQRKNTPVTRLHRLTVHISSNSFTVGFSFISLSHWHRTITVNSEMLLVHSAIWHYVQFLCYVQFLPNAHLQ